MKNRLTYAIIYLLIFPFFSCVENRSQSSIITAEHLESSENKNSETEASKNIDIATFAAGCFWCVEEQFRQLKGVTSVVSGYTGGHVKNPHYEAVITGNTGHAEACHITFDSSIISYDELLEAFFIAHDPTQLNRQGNDVGTQYRSAIFYHNEEQKKLVDYYIKKLDEENAYPQKIVTEVKPFTKFYEAENYHQNYYNKNKQVPYCQYVIKPKLDKFREVFKDKLKQS